MPTFINLHLLGAGLCLLGAPLYLPLHVGCLPLPVGCPSLSASACWVPASAGWVSFFICFYMLDACLCLLGTYLLLSNWVGMGLSLCRPTGRIGWRARGQPSGSGGEREEGNAVEGVGLELGNHRP